ncbi:hypothetical protein BDF19DRAFT_222307 [Syncephalis fuscata]|nr:hypothetical protein BDF19DRAFT_222307 [Syncephalis fuscata]
MNDTHSDPAALLTVRIRSPVLDLPDDFQVSVQHDSHILQLKEELASTAMVKPLRSTDLHLIYQGRILTDEQPLAAILKDTSMLQTFHMVSKRPVDRSTSLSSTALGKRPIIEQRVEHTSTMRRRGHGSAAMTTSTACTSAVNNNSNDTQTTQAAVGTTGDLAVNDDRIAATTSQHTYHTVTLFGVRYLLQVSNSTPNVPNPNLNVNSLVQTMVSQSLLQENRETMTINSQQHELNNIDAWTSSSSSTTLGQIMVKPTLLVNRSYSMHHVPNVRETSSSSSIATPLITANERQRIENEVEAEAEARRREREAEQLQRDQEAEERQQNERVAHFWLLVKLAFFSYIFSQNADIGQMFMVHFIALVIFLYQTDRLNFLQEWWSHCRQLLPSARQNDAAEQQQANRADATHTTTDSETTTTDTPVLPASRWGQIERALTTFVTSLVPTEPEGIDPLAMEQDGEIANEMF